MKMKDSTFSLTLTRQWALGAIRVHPAGRQRRSSFASEFERLTVSNVARGQFAVPGAGRKVIALESVCLGPRPGSGSGGNRRRPFKEREDCIGCALARVRRRVGLRDAENRGGLTSSRIQACRRPAPNRGSPAAPTGAWRGLYPRGAIAVRCVTCLAAAAHPGLFAALHPAVRIFAGEQGEGRRPVWGQQEENDQQGGSGRQWKADTRSRGSPFADMPVALQAAISFVPV